jgi:F0F1-type ATP synthase assembly protein I
VKRRLVQFGVIFLGIEAWVALRDTTSVLSLVIGCVSVAILACYFAFRVWREIQAIMEDNKQAQDRRERASPSG